MHKVIFRILKRSIIGFLVVILAVAVILGSAWLLLPDGSEFKTENPQSTAMMRDYAVQKKLKQSEIRYQPVALSQISKHLIHTIILSEDARFYTHPGIDLEALKFAMETNLQRREYALGGSTITQQLAKNLYLKSRKSLFRKFAEIIIAYKMDRTLSKRRILELYLNIAEFGPALFGAEAASRYYFGIPAAALNVDQATRLAALLPSPRKHSPHDGTKFTETRRKRLLRWLMQTGYIDTLTYYQLKSGEAHPAAADSSVAEINPAADSLSQEISTDSSFESLSEEEIVPLDIDKLLIPDNHDSLSDDPTLTDPPQ